MTSSTTKRASRRRSRLARLLARRRRAYDRRFYRGRGWRRWWGRLSSRFIVTQIGLGAFVVLSSGILVRIAMDYSGDVTRAQVEAGLRAAELAQPLYRDFVEAKRQAFELRAAQLARQLDALSGDAVVATLEEATGADGVILAVEWWPRDRPELRQRWTDGEAQLDDPEPDRESSFEVRSSTESRVVSVRFARDVEAESRFRELAVQRQQLDSVRFAGSWVARDAFETGLWWALLAAGAVVFGIALAVGWVLARRATNKLDEIGLVMRKVARGHVDARVSRLGNNELGELAGLFNAMLDEQAHIRSKVEYLQRVGIWQDMARRIAHEIKNPLTPIRLAVQELRDKYPRRDDRFGKLLVQAVEIVEDEVESLRRLVTSFSQFAKVPEVKLAPVDIGRMLLEFERAYGHLTDRPEDDLVIVTPHSTVMVVADRQLLKFVLVNLVENAVLSCRSAGREAIRVEIDIDIQASHPSQDGEREDDDRAEPADHTRDAIGHGPWIDLRVSDNGPGVPPEHRERVFEPYETTRERGTGLGLAIAKKVVLDHGGRIHIESSSLGGARVVIRLPCEDAEPPSQRAISHEPRAS